MSKLRYPNETPEYRAARDALQKDEDTLIAQTKALAEKRRALPRARAGAGLRIPVGAR